MKRDRISYTGSFIHNPDVLPADQEYGLGKTVCDYLQARFDNLDLKSHLDTTSTLFCGMYTFIVRYRRWAISVCVAQVRNQEGYLVQLHPEVNETALWRQLLFPPLEDLTAVATKVDEWLKEKEGINHLRWQDKQATKLLDYSGGSTDLVLIESPEGAAL